MSRISLRGASISNSQVRSFIVHLPVPSGPSNSAIVNPSFSNTSTVFIYSLSFCLVMVRDFPLKAPRNLNDT